MKKTSATKSRKVAETASEYRFDYSKAKPNPDRREAEKRMGLSILALFDQFDQGSGEVRDMVMALITPPTPGAKAEAVNVRIARIAYGEDTPAKSGFAIEGLQFASVICIEPAFDLLVPGCFHFGYRCLVKGYKQHVHEARTILWSKCLAAFSQLCYLIAHGEPPCAGCE